jgi:hypothetical protein
MNIFKVILNPDGKRALQRYKHTLENNIKTHLIKTTFEDVNWNEMVSNGAQHLAYYGCHEHSSSLKIGNFLFKRVIITAQGSQLNIPPKKTELILQLSQS